jgi:hypothetical protein
MQLNILVQMDGTTAGWRSRVMTQSNLLTAHQIFVAGQHRMAWVVQRYPVDLCKRLERLEEVDLHQ